jgi:hypothetical protein
MANRMAGLGDVALVQGRLGRVISINTERAVTFEFPDGKPCPTCGRADRITINEGCGNWKDWVRPVTTCGDDPEAGR